MRRIQRHHMMVAASFMIGLDVDRKGIGHRVARAATDYGVDNLNVSFLTPLPGTRLWEQMRAEERIPLDRFPQDWKYYTLMHPVARYVGLSLEGAIEEMTACNRSFYSRPRIARRMAGSVYHGRSPLFSLIHNLSSRRNSQLLTKAYAEFKREHGERLRETPRL